MWAWCEDMRDECAAWMDEWQMGKKNTGGMKRLSPGGKIDGSKKHDERKGGHDTEV